MADEQPRRGVIRRYPGNPNEPDEAPPSTRRRQDIQRAQGIPIDPNHVLAEFANFDPADLENEEWRQLPAPLDAFQASNLGRIKRGNNIVTQRQRISSTDRRLYVDLQLPDHRQRGVDDLVLLAFNDDADQRIQLPYIIHHSGDETNNHLDNLERATLDDYHTADDASRTAAALQLPQGLPRRRIIRSRRMNSVYDPLLLPSHPNYVRRRYIYEDGQVSNTVADGQFIRQRVNLAGIRIVEFSQGGVSRYYPVDELMVDSWIGFDPDRRDVIHNDHNLSNLTEGNLRPANREEYIAHITNHIRVAPDEVFRPVAHLDNIDYSHYIVSNRGRVYALQTRSFLNSYDGQHGFECVQLYDQHQSQHYSLHLIVWCAFNGPLQEGFTITHLDGDRLNNFANNLHQVTLEESLVEAIAERGQWFRDFRDPNLDDTYDEDQREIRGERWEPIRNLMGDLRCPLPATRYQVSNRGRVRRTATGRIIRLQVSSNGYQYVLLNGRGFMVQRLVASCFVPNEYPEERFLVYHRDGDCANNYSENLVWASVEEFERFTTTTRYLVFRRADQHEIIFQTLEGIQDFDFDGQTFTSTAIRNSLMNGTDINGWAIFRMIDGAVERANENRLQQQVPMFAPIVADEAPVAQPAANPIILQDPLETQAGINPLTGMGVPQP